MISFLGIYREPMCSPGRHRENDATILELNPLALVGTADASGPRAVAVGALMALDDNANARQPRQNSGSN